MAPLARGVALGKVKISFLTLHMLMSSNALIKGLLYEVTGSGDE